ncbi:MAG: hypothetical protein SWO11_11075 [Thermodesulfobacteriota bacterium]|nr:hypothetical protein [Thermodesulfobacteriota bacterium]
MRLSVHSLIGISALVVVLLSLTLFVCEKGRIGWSVSTIMVVAAILRLLFLFRQPELSDDIYRYLLDGLQSLLGSNPYALAPTEIMPQNEEIAILITKVNHPNMVTIYPPAAQLVFILGALLNGGVFGVKILLTAVDLATCAMLLRLLAALELPLCRGVLYAWHPLPIIEISASGHIDGAGILFLFVTLFLLIMKTSSHDFGSTLKNRFQHIQMPLSRGVILSFFAGFAFAFSCLVKLFPIVFLPGFIALLRGPSRAVFIIGTTTGSILLTIPFLPDIQQQLHTLTIYLCNWEFAGFSYHALKRLTGSTLLTRFLLGFGFFFAIVFLYWNLYKNNSAAADYAIHPFSLCTKETFLSVITTFYKISILYLLITPTLYPWYALCLVSLLPFTTGSAGLLLSWSVFLGYRVLIPYTLLHQWVDNGATAFMIWSAPVTALLLHAVIRRLQR